MSKSTCLLVSGAIVLTILACIWSFGSRSGSPPLGVSPAPRENVPSVARIGECKLSVSLDKKEITIAQDAVVQVTIDAVKNLPEGSTLTEYALDKMQLVWWSDDCRVSACSGYGRDPTGQDAQSPEVKLPVTRKFDVMKAFASGSEGRVISGIYHVQAFISGPELKFASDPITVTLVQSTAEGGAKCTLLDHLQF